MPIDPKQRAARQRLLAELGGTGDITQADLDAVRAEWQDAAVPSEPAYPDTTDRHAMRELIAAKLRAEHAAIAARQAGTTEPPPPGSDRED